MNLLDLLDRPIAFHRAFVTLTGSINAALFLSQAVYWSHRATEEDGSFYKSRDEWQDETGLTHEQQDSARKRLREMGIISEKYDRIKHKVFYTLSRENLRKGLTDITVSPNRETRFPQTGKHGFPKPGNTVSVYNAETTAETTAVESDDSLGIVGNEKKKDEIPKKTGYSVPDCFEKIDGFTGALAGWIEARKKKRNPPTGYAIQLFINRLSERPQDSVAALELAIERGWATVKWDWFDNERNKANGKTATKASNSIHGKPCRIV